MSSLCWCVFGKASADCTVLVIRFRVPQRRVWEREGTRGLLSWLRGRLE